MEESPTLGARRIVKLEAVLAFSGSDIEDKGLIHVSEQIYASCPMEIISPLADSSVEETVSQ